MDAIIDKIVIAGLSLVALIFVAGWIIDPVGMKQGASILTCGKPSCSCARGPL